MTTVYHGTPITPREALLEVGRGRSLCISFFEPRDADVAAEIAPFIMYDNGAFSFWQEALRNGKEWDDKDRDWRGYYRWLEERLFHPGRWAVIPDSPGAPSQINDGLLNDWPFGTSRGSPLWHMDASLERLGRLCEKYDRISFGWIGEIDPKTGSIRKDQRNVGCNAYRKRMDEVATFFGNRWPAIHMMRGVSVAHDYPFRVSRQHLPRPERVAIRCAARGDCRRPVAREECVC